ncbi:MAG: hypothetical protein MJE66_01915 [Proteobacteria bacterium]|nr:hypothetical protein [Pseudomonadota bacterium]
MRRRRRGLRPNLREHLTEVAGARLVIAAAALFIGCGSDDLGRRVDRERQRLRHKAHGHEHQ